MLDKRMTRRCVLGSCLKKVEGYITVKSGCVLTLGRTLVIRWHQANWYWNARSHQLHRSHAVKLAQWSRLRCLCNQMGACLKRKVDTKACASLQTVPPMQDGCTTALGVFDLPETSTSRRRSQSVIHPRLMSPFSTAPLSCSGGGRSVVRRRAVGCAKRKPATADGAMTAIRLVDDNI